MPAWRNHLRLVWEQQLLDGDAIPLLAFIEGHPQCTATCGHGYPHLHRVCDITLSGKPFRVLRCFTCGEELSFKPISKDGAHLNETGVPYWLRGEKLANWIEDMTTFGDPKSAIDWESYK